MGRIIAVANQKGGVGKTTTALNLASCLVEKRNNVLAIDMDPQGNMTSGLGISKSEVENTVYDLIIGEKEASDCIIKNVQNTTWFKNKLDLIPSNVDLSAAEIELVDMNNKEFIIRDAIAGIKDEYDYIIIDCPPSLSLLTINAMTTADSVLIPVQTEYYALEGLSQLLYTIDLIRERLNDRLHIEGIVFTMYDSRTNLAEQVVENVKENIEEHIFKTLIPRNIRLAESPSFGQPINLYDSRSAGSEAYRKLAKEVMKNKTTN